MTCLFKWFEKKYSICNKFVFSLLLVDWPDLTTRLKIVKKSDIKMCSKESFAKICESRQVIENVR